MNLVKDFFVTGAKFYAFVFGPVIQAVGETLEEIGTKLMGYGDPE